jgi:hypothetical protein
MEGESDQSEKLGIKRKIKNYIQWQQLNGSLILHTQRSYLK